MPIVYFVAPDGTTRQATARVGASVMVAAITADIPGIVAECGGECACGTCHVQIDAAWIAATGGPGDFEDQLLELVPDRGPNSRLSCQITMSGALDGLVVHVPPRQRG